MRMYRMWDVTQTKDFYLALKDESQGEPDCLEKQQHTENTEELQREKDHSQSAFRVNIWQWRSNTPRKLFTPLQNKYI